MENAGMRRSGSKNGENGSSRRPVEAVVLGNLNLVRALGAARLSVAVMSSHGDDRTFYSRYCSRRVMVPDLHVSQEAFVLAMEAFGRSCEGRPVLFYGDDHSLMLISTFRARLESFYRFSMPDAEVVEALVDKVLFTRLARSKDLPIPETLLSEEAENIQDILGRLRFPCVLKPAVRRGWFRSGLIGELGGKPQKVIFIQNRSELEHLYPKMQAYDPHFLVQEAVPGGDDEIYSYHAYFDGDAQPLGYFIGRKIRTYPSGSGVSTYLRLVKEETVRRLGLEIGQKLRLKGVVKMDFKRDARSNRFYLLEINPRYNLWNYLGAAAGVNLPYLAYEDCMGGDGIGAGANNAYRTDIRWLSFKEDVKAFLDSRSDNKMSFWEWILSYRKRKVYNVFAWNDPYPWVVSSAQYLSLKLRRIRGKVA